MNLWSIFYPKKREIVGLFKISCPIKKKISLRIREKFKVHFHEIKLYDILKISKLTCLKNNDYDLKRNLIKSFTTQNKLI